MRTYLVRMMPKAGEEGEEYSSVLLGVAIVEDLVGLFEQMDEHTNPHGFEYMRVPRRLEGSLFLGGEKVLLAGEAWTEYYCDREWKEFPDLLDVPFEQWYSECYRPVHRNLEEVSDE